MVGHENEPNTAARKILCDISIDQNQISAATFSGFLVGNRSTKFHIIFHASTCLSGSVVFRIACCSCNMYIQDGVQDGRQNINFNI